MRWLAFLRKEGSLIAALFVGVFVFFGLEVLYLETFGKFVFLTGIPTPGGAPLSIHVFNVGLKAAWSALAYGGAMRLLFGRVAWSRVVLLWLLGVVVAGIAAGLAVAGTISVAEAVANVLRVYALLGVFVIRDWVSR